MLPDDLHKPVIIIKKNIVNTDRNWSNVGFFNLQPFVLQNNMTKQMAAHTSSREAIVTVVHTRTICTRELSRVLW